jgi:hypothetical protein
MTEQAGATPPGRDLLQHVLVEVKRAEREVLAADRPDAEALKRWLTLRDVEERLRRSAPRTDAAPWLAFVLGTVALIALLQWVRCGQTELSARLVVSALDLEAAAEGLIELPRKPSSVTATGLQSLEIPNADGTPLPVLASEGSPLEVRLLPDPAAKINLKPIRLVDRTRLGMTFTAPHAVEFRVEGRSLEFQASLLNTVELRSPRARTKIEYADSAGVFGRSESLLGVNVVAESWGRCVVCAPLPVRSAKFVETRHDGDVVDAVRELSSIRRGTLYLPAVGVERQLRRGEWLQLRFTKGATTELVSLAVPGEGDGFEIELHGSVESIEAGSALNPVDLRPTWLEWLRSRHGPALVWATCVWAFGAMGVFRKWSRREL